MGYAHSNSRLNIFDFDYANYKLASKGLKINYKAAKDYASAYAEWEKLFESEEERKDVPFESVFTDYNLAKQLGFQSILEFLIDNKQPKRASPEMDFDSIMFYTSAQSSADSGGCKRGDLSKCFMVRKNALGEDELIRKNVKPSAGDIAWVKGMYRWVGA